MKHKLKDQLYCGVDADKISKSVPTLNLEILKYLAEFIVDRYNIHLMKDVMKTPAPWTDNEIFKQVKFTNVRREHDRQSLFLINNIAYYDTDWKTKFWNIVMFRMFNISTAWEELSGGTPFNLDNLTSKQYRDLFRADLKLIESKGLKLFTNAFNTGGLKQSLALPDFDMDTRKQQRRGEIILKDVNGNDVNYKLQREKLLNGEIVCEDFEPYMPMRIIRYIGKASSELFPDLHEEVMNAETQKDAYELLLKIRGFSRFLAYQVFVDLTYCPEFPFSENEFTISGPGCDAGLNLLFEDRGGMNYEECLFWLRDNQQILNINFDKLFSDLEPHDRCLNVMCLENCFCEISKYVRCKQALKEGKKPRGKVSTAKLVSSVNSIEAQQTNQTKKLW